MRVKIVKNTLFFAIFLYFLGSHSQCHSWFDFEHSDWLRADFFAWVKFFSDWYLSEFWPDWDKQYIFSEQNFAGNSLKVVSKRLEQNTKLPFVTAQPPATDLYVDQHFFSLIFLTKPFNFQEKKGDTYYFIFCLLDEISFNILMTFLLP